jgi:hypothetical protein
MTDYERGYEQGKADATGKMYPEMRILWEEYFDKRLKEHEENRRQWIGLTDEEIDKVHNKLKTWFAGTYNIRNVYQALEAKLKEKNGG